MKAKDVPVTQKMLFGVRDELIERNNSLRDILTSKTSSLEGKFSSLDSKISSVESRLSAAIHETKAEVYRLAVLVEEQNAQNRIVLDGLTGLFGRQDRVEKRVDDLEKVLLKAK